MNKQSFESNKRSKEIDFVSTGNVFSRFIEKLFELKTLLLPKDILKIPFIDAIVHEIYELQAVDFCCGLMFYMIENIMKFKDTENEF